MRELAPSCWNQDLPISDRYSVYSSLFKVLRTSTYCSFVTVAVMPDYSVKNGPMMPLAEIALHTMHLGKCSLLVATLLDLEVLQKAFVFKFTFLQYGSELHLRSEGG